MNSSPEEILAEAEDLVLDLASNSKDKEAIAKAVAQFLDAILPLDVLIPSPIGAVLEKNDEVIFKTVVSQLLRVFHADPAKKAERIQRRQERREKRKARRAQKKAERHGN